jgi:hypothetical protein
MDDHELAAKLLQDHFTATAALIALFLALVSGCVPAGRRDLQFEDAYATALRACIALAPENVKDLGVVAPDEVAFWFRKARLQSSMTFWNPRGRDWIAAQPPHALDSIESACDIQLVLEAKREREVEAPYPVPLEQHAR